MIKIFSFVASCAGEKSKTAAFSDTLSEAFRKRAEEEGMEVRYERMTGADVHIDYCRSCNSCFRTGICPLDAGDDMKKLKEKMLAADILFFGSPVYLWQMSGMAKSVLDRIGYWAHRYELLGKPCLTFTTTDSSHGSEVSQEMAKLLRFMGTIVVDAGTKTAKGIETDPADTAEKLMAVYKDPASGVSFLQQNAHVSRVIMIRRYLKRIAGTGEELIDEARVFHERGLDKYVILEEAIRELIPKPD